MIIGPLVFFWLPVISSFIFGIIGGKVAGSFGRAMTSAILPAVIVALFLFLISLTHGPLGIITGIVSGIGFLLLVLFHGIALLLGAAIGGIL